MIYVFDSSPFIDLFRHYYPQRFPTLWENFNDLISRQTIVSVQEVRRELERKEDRLSDWAGNHKELFLPPDVRESRFVAEIFKIKHFRVLIEKKEQYIEGPAADPFIIAKAKIIPGCVVTQEKLKANAAKIPNVCKHFDIRCVDLEGFMEQENWIF